MIQNSTTANYSMENFEIKIKKIDAELHDEEKGDRQ